MHLVQLYLSCFQGAILNNGPHISRYPLFQKTRLTQKRLEESETGLVVYPRKDETLGDVFCPRGDGAGGDEALEAADLVGQRGRAAWHRVHAGGGGREVHPRRVAVAVRSPPLRRTRTAAATC
ncbi:hypothetical protein BRADI_1g58954v3 [Brachypodium distachyon]|uniref:Uncharacterized protein n=1 Tax=Brachypodium distachyon TaxID=15368 RepID=A0A0Q3HEE9_BRADI|nr:hypothetical protein BRADI_1g58954v3 [Brachypodium distachyon]